MRLSPAVKYTLGRVGLFVVVSLLLWPVPIDLLVKLMIAIIASFGLQFVLLGKWRNEMIGQVDQAVTRRKADKAKLRSALAGEDDGEV
ncbi:DUF4229 domain-containing protein [Rugosimonospora africana]|uniref:DUF4229 domain-containing protein n=1 Tax=Rugosimonospora africana TaxID=556532 RepID=A0A8J3QPM5_9ACTN|nr:DUF4229 domain-containing protein [Rugosimonospora africana]GIH13430.1 hypothetical protein Raf01_16020 [Rugosimonospora africana]